MTRRKHIKNIASIIIRDIDVELRKELRHICLELDMSMNEVLKGLIAEFVEGKRAEKKPK